jgi:hypothetical protein
MNSICRTIQAAETTIWNHQKAGNRLVILVVAELVKPLETMGYGVTIRTLANTICSIEVTI